MKKFSILVCIVLFIHSLSYGQDDDFYSADGKEEIKKEERAINRWSFGGNFWMGFGSTTYIELSPAAMYKFTPRLYAGPGATYIYQSYRNLGISTSTYGVKAIGTFYVLKNLKESIHINIGDVIFQTEYEALNIELFDANTFNSTGRLWIDNLLVGGGLFQPLGERGGISVLVLFDVTQNPYSPYSNPIFRLGFYF